MTEDKKRRALQLIKDHVQPSETTTLKSPSNKTTSTIHINGGYVQIGSRDNTYVTNPENSKLSAEIERLKDVVVLLEKQAKIPSKKRQSIRGKIACFVLRLGQIFT